MSILGHRRRNLTADKNRTVSTDTTDQNVVPVGLDDAHSYVAPGPAPFTELPYGAPQYSDGLGKDLPTIADQDRILVHYFSPPVDRPPQEWYNDRNVDRIYRGTQEHFFTANIPESGQAQQADPNPWLGSTPTNNYHYNARFMQSNYRFLRPFDQRWERTNTLAQAGSQARVAYPHAVGGMLPQAQLRNTFRLAPTARDIENIDLNDTHVAAVEPAVYVSPQTKSSRWGL